MPDWLGLMLDPDEKATVKSVAAGSSAERAGFKVADRIQTLAGQPIISIADVQWVLEQAKAVPAANAAGILRIDSTASNAEIEVDGEFLGTTPLEVPLAPGLHSVTIRKPGFSTWVREITVVEDADQSLFAELKAEE